MEQKTIHLNPAFMKLSQSKTIKKERKPKPKPASLGEHKLRKKLLDRIHEFQSKVEQENLSGAAMKSNDVKDEIQVFDSEFDKSIDFLKQLSERKRKASVTQKNNQRLSPVTSAQTKPSPTIQVNTALINNSVDAQPPTPLIDKPVISVPPVEHTTQPATAEPKPAYRPQNQPQNQTIKIRPPPPYSCMKNGKKPTYRQLFMRPNNAPQKVEPKITIHNKESTNAPPSLRSEKLLEIKQQFNPKRRKPRKIRRKKMTTVKHQLGKSGRKVCVLIKNRSTRKQIQKECGLLKQNKISDVKNYLKKHNLLKSSSIAPNDVLKATYEQAILAGEINNKNADTLIHNYMN
tara:strand:+ start:1770 stop:2807 length:1038 start_codon:yes stop_codon:yes gene_type:complete